MIAAAASELQMPRLTDSMDEGTIVRWLKAPGDAVAKGEPLLEVETDKADMVYESDVAGTLLEILVAEGDSAPVGAVIARIGDADAREKPSLPPADPSPEDGSAGSSTRRAKVKASPVARRLAKDLGIDLASVKGSGPQGRVLKADVEAAAGKAEPVAAPTPPVDGAKGATELVEPTKLQRTVARRMAESKATIPHIHLTANVDMTRCVEERARLRETAAAGEPVPSYNDMVVKACALALRAQPRANASWTDEGFQLHARVNVGIAVAAENALIVPTIFDADRKGLLEIAAESRRLAERVRSGEITPPELAGGTFTVSNLGMHGVDEFKAVINPPQAAILAVGSIAERPVGRNGRLALAPTMRLTLACDHRILYGADGAELLGRIRSSLEAPLRLAG